MSRHSDTLSCIPNQPVFALTPYCCVLSGEATNTNFIVLCLTRSGLEPTIYRTRGEHANHYTINAVQIIIDTSYIVCKVCLTCNLFENTKMCSFDNWTSSYCESVAKITPSLIWQKYYVGSYASTPNQEWPITDCWKNIMCGNTDRDPNQVWLLIVHVYKPVNRFLEWICLHWFQIKVIAHQSRQSYLSYFGKLSYTENKLK
jgi:hypothetical protein